MRQKAAETFGMTPRRLVRDRTGRSVTSATREGAPVRCRIAVPAAPDECPIGSGHMMNLFEVAKDISERLTRIFLRDERGRCAVYGGIEKVPERSPLARSRSVL